MKWFRATHNVTGEVTGPLAAGDEQDAPGGYDPAEWTFTALEREPGEIDRIEGSSVVADPAKAEAKALRRIDREQDRRSAELTRLAVSVGELRTWDELQDLKRVTDAEVTAMTAPQRQARWPFVIALMTENGTALSGFRSFAATAEAELAGRIAALATLSAKALLARRAVRAAPTAAEKIAAAESVSWGES